MKKLLFFNFLLMFSLIKAMAQTGLQPAYIIKTDTVIFQQLPYEYWQTLEDKDGLLTFDQVLQPSLAKRFHYTTTTKVNYTFHTNWFRYVLENGMDHDAKISLGGTDDEQSTFYVTANSGLWNRYETGRLTPWSKLNGFKTIRIIPLSLKPGQELMIYQRIYNHYIFYSDPNNISIGFGSTMGDIQEYVKSDSLYIEYIHDSILFGLLLFAALFNFFFFRVSRERVYLYFSVYLVFIGLGRMSNEFYFVFLREYRVFQTYMIEFMWIFAIISLTFFIRSLLQTKLRLPRWDKFLLVLNICYFLIGSLVLIIGFRVNTIGFVIATYGNIAVTISNILTFFLLLKNKEKSDKPLMTLILPAFVFWGAVNVIIRLYQNLGYTILGDLSIWLSDHWHLIETLCLVWLVTAYSWILLQRFRILQKKIAQQALEKEKERNQLIAEQKAVLEQKVDERTTELKNSLIELKTTQTQLIQREKMASLGELTAGIAHEIQNPLNFVNNFSDVNKELLAEMKNEIGKGNLDEVKSIANDVIENEEKINHHGKRADFIVKGMLEHSRTSKDEKILTNINVLANEFLKLSYHGLRAKNKNFNAELVTNFDETLPKIELAQQDIGRVLLNLFNNAFYAVNQKQKEGGLPYAPVVTVSTFKAPSGGWGLSVKDNGNGIPEAIKDKIMQPFFTTKPAGEGTGLGLSLSYDIIVKGHGGSIDVDTKEGEYTEFIIKLPAVKI
ncbi:MAG TPA: ATP-binding protein [Mucilaginibacter sp.]|jgi:signal transduction histidine kinase